MNIEELFSELSNNQRKLVKALLDNPEGLLSRELAECTAISNKSATMSPEVRETLEKHGLELVVERGEGGALWVLKRVNKEEQLRQKLIDGFNSIITQCEELKTLLYCS